MSGRVQVGSCWVGFGSSRSGRGRVQVESHSGPFGSSLYPVGQIKVRVVFGSSLSGQVQVQLGWAGSGEYGSGSGWCKFCLRAGLSK